MSTNSLPVLDYASPAAKTHLRVGTKSVLRMSHTPSELRIVESLEEHLQAIGALIFSTISVGLLVIPPMLSARDLREALSVVSVMSLIILPYVLTALAVIDSNWRRTILDVSREQIILRMISPLRRTRTHEWPSGHLQSVQLLVVGKFLYEIEVNFRGQQIHLFTGHRLDELKDVQQTIREALVGAQDLLEDSELIMMRGEMPLDSPTRILTTPVGSRAQAPKPDAAPGGGGDS